MTDETTSQGGIAGLKSGILSLFDAQLTALYQAQTQPQPPEQVAVQPQLHGGLSLQLSSAMTEGDGLITLPGSAAQAGADLFAAAMSTQYDGAVVQTGGGVTYVLIDATARGGDGAALLDQLNALGMVNGSSFGAMASGWIPVGALTEMTGLSTLAFARENAAISSAGTTNAQADHAQNNDLARATYNVDGTGIKVGVLSDSFNTPNHNGYDGQADTMAVDISRGDLPAATTVLQDQTSGTDEGRGMAQLVHDLAPGAAIAFATAYNGQAGFANNIIALANAGAKVIVDDVRYYYEPAYQNGVIAQAVNTVTAQGVAYFSSAGNSGFEGYESAWHNGSIGSSSFDNDQMLAFAPGQDYLTFTATGKTDIFNLQWDQPAASAGGPGSASDVDFWITNAAGTILASSLANNLGGDPVEGISFKGVAGQTYYLRVGLYAGPTPTDIKITSFSAPLSTTAWNYNDGTTYGHNSAQGAMAVAAADYRLTPNYGVSPPQLEYFSSGGPAYLYFDDAGNRLATPIASAVAFTAVDGSDTSFFGSDVDGNGKPNFFGTSAAAPDAAATAALMLQANPALTPDDIRALLIDTALDMDNPDTPVNDVGMDAATGAGLIRADLAVQAVRNGVINNTTLVTVYGTHLNDQISAGSGANTLLGGDGNDSLRGNAGNDTLDGGNGSDTAVFSGARASYTITQVAGGFTVTDNRSGSPDGTDTLKNVEYVQFSDQTVTLTVSSNHAPTVATPLPDQSVNEDAAYSWQVPAGAFADQDAGDTLSYAATLANGNPLPAWLTFSPATRTFSGTPANGDVGVISVKVTATDSGAATASDVFDLTIVNTNDAPTVANALANQSVNEDSAFAFTVPANTFADVDVGDTLTYAATLANGSALPSWLTFNPTTHAFSGTPANGDVGVIAVKVTVTDSGAAAASSTFNLTVINTNDAPTVATPITNQSVNEDGAFSFVVPANTFADVDVGDTLTYAATLASGSALPSWLTFNPTTRTFSGTPANGDVGVIAVKVTVTDSGAATASSSFNLTVVNTNDAPTVANALANQSVNEDSPFAFTAPANTFADVDVGDTLTYAATLANGSALPSWLTFNTATHAFSGTPANGDVGIVSVKVTVTDTGAASASSSFNLTVVNTNDAPVLSGPSTGQVTEDSVFSATGQLIATDPDVGATAAWSVVGPATGTYGSFGVNSAGLWTYTLNNTAAQPLTSADHIVESYTIKVDDGQGGTDTRLISITINGADEAGGAQTGTAGDDTLTGTAGDDTLLGLAGNDFLYGGNGNDTLNGGAGNDTISGGAGNDTVTYADATAGVKLSLAIATGQTTGGSGTDIVTGVENVTGSDFNDTLTGDAGVNILVGRLGGDVLDGGAGADTLDGGAGNDTYLVDDPNDVVIEATGGGTDLIKATASSYTLGAASEVETLTYVGAGAFTGTGNALNNTLNGGANGDTLYGLAGDDKLNGLAGNDTLYGGDGNDALDGGAGNDVMDGGAGNDTYLVDSANDVIVEAAGGGTDTVKASSASYTLSAEVETLTYVGAGSFVGTGNASANTITGGAAADTLSGLAGDDKLIGGAGADTLHGGDGKDALDGGIGDDIMDGGAGDDSYTVDSAGDQVIEAAGSGNDSVKVSIASYSLPDEVEILSYVGAAAFTGTGNAGANTITGGGANDTLSGLAGADKLNGGAGNDVLIGGAGADTLSGGVGADAFVYQDVSDSLAATADTITDFKTSEGDYLDLTAVDANTTLAGDQAFAFIGTAAFSHTAGELRYQVSGSTLTLQADVNGDGVADMVVKLTGVASLSATDFHP